MQVQDSQDRIIMSDEVDILHVPNILGNLIQQADVKQVIITPLPKENDVIQLSNGLKFTVVKILNRNRFVIKLVPAVDIKPRAGL